MNKVLGWEEWEVVLLGPCWAPAALGLLAAEVVLALVLRTVGRLLPGCQLPSLRQCPNPAAAQWQYV